MIVTWAELNAVAQHMDEHPNASGPVYAPLLLGWTRALLNEVERLKAANEQTSEERKAIAETANNLNRENADLRDMIAEVQRACDKARAGADVLRADELHAALQLLWEEVNDEERCAQERAPGVYSHHVSEPCRSAVMRALKRR